MSDKKKKAGAKETTVAAPGEASGTSRGAGGASGATAGVAPASEADVRRARHQTLAGSRMRRPAGKPSGAASDVRADEPREANTKDEGAERAARADAAAAPTIPEPLDSRDSRDPRDSAAVVTDVDHVLVDALDEDDDIDGARDSAVELPHIETLEADVEEADVDETDEADTIVGRPTMEADGDVAARIRELEERLDRMIDEASRRSHAAREGEPPSRRASLPPLSSRSLPATDEDATVFDTARELLSTEFYMRKWGRLGMRNRSEEVDDFGFDPVYEEKALPLFNFLYERYFRVDCEGAGRIPDGRCLLVSNHSGTVPWDGLMMKLAVKREHPQHRDVRWLAEDTIFHFPFIGSFTNRIGAVRACQENAERLLRQEALVAVFPEGVKGIGKLFKERYRLQRFGRGGFVKLCLRTGTPIVPVAIVGAEETNPLVGKLEHFTKALGIPYIPITPTFPLLGPLGLLPAPTKWRIQFGEPLAFDGYGPEAAEDEILVGRLAERVRATIQAMLDRAVGERRSVFFG